MRNGQSALVAMDLVKDFGDGPVLEDVSLTLGVGEAVALLGPNGIGKTTLLNICAGLQEPTSGSVTVFGNPAGSLEARADVAYVPDRGVFYDDISLAELVEFIARLHGVDDWTARAEPIVSALDLSDQMGMLPQRLSLGQRQKASILIALVRPFRILLADEPFSALDERSREAAVKLFGELRDRGITSFIATHDPIIAGLMERAIRLDVPLQDSATGTDAPRSADRETPATTD